MEPEKFLLDETTGRIEFIDTLKGFIIFLMLWGHTSLPKNVKIFIYSFHMPIFFILSGMTINLAKYYAMDFKTFLKKILKRYLFPYFFINLASFPLAYYTWNICGGYNRSIPKMFYSILIGNTEITKYLVSSPSWFLLTFFLSQLIFYFLVKVSKENKQTLFILCCISVIIGYFDEGQKRPWHYNTAFTGVMFLFIGNTVLSFIREYQLEKNKKLWFAIPFLLILGWALRQYNGDSTMNKNIFGKSLPIYFIMVISISSAFIILFMLLPKIRILNFIGKNTILYLSITSLLIRLFTLYCPKPFDTNYLLNFALALVLYFIMIPLFLFVNKFCPYIVGKKRQIKSNILNNIIKILIILTCLFFPAYYLSHFHKIWSLLISFVLACIFVPLANKFFPIIWNEEKA